MSKPTLKSIHLNAEIAQVVHSRFAENTVTAPDEKAMIIAQRRRARQEKAAPAQSTSMKSAMSAGVKKNENAVVKRR